MSVLSAVARQRKVSGAGALSLMAAAAALLGCAGLDSADDSCATVKTCLGTNVTPLTTDGADWSCLAQTTPMAPKVTSGEMVTYKLPIVDWVDNTPIKGLVIQKCATIDSNCLMPLAMFTAPDNRSDRNVPVQLEAGFKGFLKIASSNGISTLPNGMLDTTNAYVPETYYFGDTIYTDRTVQTIIQVLRQPILAQVAGLIGIQLDFTQALLVLRVLDCAGNPAPGVKFSIDKPGEPYTLVQGLPQLPMGVDFVPTDAAGQAGFANVPPGYVFVSAFLDDANKTPVNRTAASATALPGQLTIVEVQPRPYGASIATP